MIDQGTRRGLLVLLVILTLVMAGLLRAASAYADEHHERQYRAAATEFHRLRSLPAASPEAWRDVAERFMAIHDALPGTRRGIDALYSAALSRREAWRAADDWHWLSGAAAIFRRFAATYERDRLADDALMHLGSLLSDGYNDRAGAQETYRRVIAQYPDGDQRSAAEQRLHDNTAAMEAERDRALQAKLAAAENSTDTGTAPAPTRGDGRLEDAATADAQRELAQLSASQIAAQQEVAGSGRVRAVQYWSALEWTRVILTADPGVRWTANRLDADSKRPERVYFDLKGDAPDDGVAAHTPVGDAVLEQIRVSRFDSETTRIVLDLNGLDRYEVKDFRLPNERKIVIDLHPPAEVIAALRAKGTARERTAARTTPVSQPAPNRVLPEPSVQIPIASPVRSIMIDPGHGGHDPGATGFGIAEKDLVLDISRRLRALLGQRHPNLRIGLTRDSDVFVPLQERPALAKQFGADLFVSVHLNANPITRFYGVETYFLNLTEDRDALQVAARENATSEEHMDDLNGILRDLLRDTTLVESGELARSVQSSLVGVLRSSRSPVRDLGVKQAPFLVLMGAEMPGVLIEAGFLTNRNENQRLQNSTHLDRIAEGIYDGLRRYIEQQNIIAAGHPAGSVAANTRP